MGRQLQVAILGAGISGLAVGWHLKRRLKERCQITLIEKSSRPGGAIQTVEKGGFLFEQGPRGCRPTGAGVATLQLIEALGMEKEVIADNRAARRRFLFADGKLSSLPSGPFSFFFSPLFGSCVREFFRSKGGEEEESIGSFFERRFGPEFTQHYIDPLVTGIWAGDPYQLSMRACLPRLMQWEQESGSVIKGYLAQKREIRPLSPFVRHLQRAALISLRGGMEQLVRRLADTFGSDLLLNQRVKRVESREKGVALLFEGGEVQTFDRLIAALPAAALAALMPGHPASGLLSSIPTAPIAIVNCGYARPLLKKRGFGYLIPSKESEKILGMVWDSSIFPEQNRTFGQTRLTVTMGGVRHPEVVCRPREFFIEVAREALSSHLGICKEPDVVAVRVVKDAVPQYLIGHTERVKEMRKRLPQGVFLLGNHYGGVSVNDCLLQAEVLAKKLSESYLES